MKRTAQMSISISTTNEDLFVWLRLHLQLWLDFTQAPSTRTLWLRRDCWFRSPTIRATPSTIKREPWLTMTSLWSLVMLKYVSGMGKRLSSAISEWLLHRIMLEERRLASFWTKAIKRKWLSIHFSIFKCFSMNDINIWFILSILHYYFSLSFIFLFLSIIYLELVKIISNYFRLFIRYIPFTILFCKNVYPNIL